MAAKLAGSGGGKYSLGQNSEINVTPFVDILLVLLIIFMVAVPMATVSIKLDLPPATPPPPDAKPIEPTFISIQKDGNIYIADTQTSLPTLATDLGTRMKINDPNVGVPTEERVMIRADADVTYDQFMSVVNQLQTDGFFKVGLINEDISYASRFSRQGKGPVATPGLFLWAFWRGAGFDTRCAQPSPTRVFAIY
jgi:biopolymer transport protein ExbD